MKQQPDMQPRARELQPPPRLLMWLVIGGVIVALVGFVAGVLVFRNVLRPGQQQRVIDTLPFMTNFLPRVDPNTTLPTVVPPTSASGMSAEDLLNAPLFTPTPLDGAPPAVAEATGEADAAGEATAASEATIEAVMLMSAVPTSAPTLIPTDSAVPISSALNLGAAVVQAESDSGMMAAGTSLLDPATTAGQPAATAVVAPTQALVSTAPAAAPALDPLEDSGANMSFAADVPAQARMFGFRYVKQSWNNCGPANVTMALSYFGWQEDQSVAASLLKPDREDKNVSPAEMVAFVNNNTGVRALARYGGTLDLLKLLVANNFPVIIETAYAPEGYDWIGHYQTVVAYDDAQQVVYLYDSYLGEGTAGEGLAEPYTQFDEQWKAFNRVFIVLYPQERDAELARLMGDYIDPVRAAELALETAQREARTNPQDKFAWFNMGTSFVRLERWDDAALAFDRALQLRLPFRMLWYQFGPFEAYYQVGRYDDVMALVNNNLNNGGQYVEETHYWQGRALAAQGDVSSADSALRRALQHNPLFVPAEQALRTLGD